MVADYMGSVGASDSMSTDDPMEYWVARLDTCCELAQYALEVLSFPPSSVLYERTFSAAGGVVTDKGTHLSTDSVDRLTFISSNKDEAKLHSFCEDLGSNMVLSVVLNRMPDFHVDLSTWLGVTGVILIRVVILFWEWSVIATCINLRM